MIIEYDDLINLLAKHWTWGDDVSPRESLLIRFDKTKRYAKDTVTYHSVEGSLIAIDIDETGEVFGIEFA